MSEWDSNITGTNATGFSPVSLSWKDRFGGLMRNHIDRSLLNGQTGSFNWNYAIEDYSSIDNQGVTPGVVLNQNENGDYQYKMVTSVLLWIRINKIVCNLCTKFRYFPIISRNIFILILFPI